MRPMPMSRLAPVPGRLAPGRGGLSWLRVGAFALRPTRVSARTPPPVLDAAYADVAARTGGWPARAWEGRPVPASARALPRRHTRAGARVPRPRPRIGSRHPPRAPREPLPRPRSVPRSRPADGREDLREAGCGPGGGQAEAEGGEGGAVEGARGEEEPGPLAAVRADVEPDRRGDDRGAQDRRRHHAAEDGDPGEAGLAGGDVLVALLRDGVGEAGRGPGAGRQHRA